EGGDVAYVGGAGEGKRGLRVGEVGGFQGGPAGEERRDLGPGVGGDDDLVPEAGERVGGMGADHAQPAGDEDHRTTSWWSWVTPGWMAWGKSKNRCGS